MSRAIVHMGTHKTGTTSFQQWAAQHAAAVEAASGIRVYEGMFRAHHFEIPLITGRPDRNTPTKCRRPDWCTPGFQRDARDHVTRQLERDGDVLISSEDISYFRHRDELDRLLDLLSPRDVEFVLVLREPQAFLRSYRAQMQKMRFTPSVYQGAFTYVEEDSWLIDYDAIIELFEGPTVVSYEETIDAYGSIIPGILRAIGVDPGRVPSWDETWENTSKRSPAQKARTQARRLVAKARGGSSSR